MEHWKYHKKTAVNSMKYGRCQIVNNSVYYYQTLYNVDLILKQVSNHNNVLRVQRFMEKSVWRIQNNVISEEHILRTRMSATEKELAPNVSDDKNKNN